MTENEEHYLQDKDILSVPSDNVVIVTRTLPVFNEILLDKFDPELHKLSKEADDFWFVGRDSIVSFCKEKFGINAWSSVKSWMNNYSFPVRHLPNGEPFLIYIEAINWALAYDNMVRKVKLDERTKHLKELVNRYGRQAH